MEANFLGVLWGSRAAVEAMRALGGDIVNMASMSSFGPVPGLAVYGATKHAVLGFTMSLQGDLDDARIPIRTHAICPDGVDTGMVRERAGRGRRRDHLLRPAHAAARGGGGEGRERDRRAPAGGGRSPRSRGVLVRSMALFPRLNLRLLPLFKKAGEKKRSKARPPRRRA